MSHAQLHAPWRMEYIRSLENKTDPTSCGCFLCDALARLDDESERRSRGILWTTRQSIVLMNRYPYTSGHLLIAPRSHTADLDALDEESLCDLQRQTARAVSVLKTALNPQGFNIGINLGRAAGAGLPGHLHQHIVPRWAGDTNFMSVVGDVRIIPHARDQMLEELLGAMSRLKIDPAT